MIKAKNKIYIGNKARGYLSEEIIGVIYDYVARQGFFEFAKVRLRKIGDRYLLEMELNDNTKGLLKDLSSLDQVRLYKIIHSWEEIYKMADTTVKASR